MPLQRNNYVTKAAVMVPRLEKKIYVMSCVCFRMHKHLFTRGMQEREGWSWRVGWGGVAAWTVQSEARTWRKN